MVNKSFEDQGENFFFFFSFLSFFFFFFFEQRKKISFIALPGKGGSQQINALKTVLSLGEMGRWFCRSGCEK